MQELFDKLAAFPLAAKLGALIGIVVLLAGGYYWFFYSDLVEEEARIQRHTTELQTEKTEYERRKAEYLAYRNEVNQLLEEQKELLQALPKRDDIEQFLESVQAQVELAGLSKVSSEREAAIPLDLYTKIPVKMTAVGTYHQINQFFKSIGDLKRIVNIEDLELAPSAVDTKDIINKTLLKANFVATTFQYLERKGPAKKATTTISAGGK